MTTATIDGRTVERGAFGTLAHGLRLTPEFREGLPVTLLLACSRPAGAWSYPWPCSRRSTTG
jgi:hypothetical protein